MYICNDPWICNGQTADVFITTPAFCGECLRDGSYGAIEVNGEAIAPSSSPNMTFQEGDVVRLRLLGGGGHGDPARRRRERIEADLKAGYVTPEGARRDYGYG